MTRYALRASRRPGARRRQDAGRQVAVERPGGHVAGVRLRELDDLRVDRRTPERAQRRVERAERDPQSGPRRLGRAASSARSREVAARSSNPRTATAQHGRTPGGGRATSCGPGAEAAEPVGHGIIRYIEPIYRRKHPGSEARGRGRRTSPHDGYSGRAPYTE